MGCGVWGFGFVFQPLGFWAWGMGFRVWGLKVGGLCFDVVFSFLRVLYCVVGSWIQGFGLRGRVFEFES